MAPAIQFDTQFKLVLAKKQMVGKNIGSRHLESDHSVSTD